MKFNPLEMIAGLFSSGSVSDKKFRPTYDSQVAYRTMPFERAVTQYFALKQLAKKDARYGSGAMNILFAAHPELYKAHLNGYFDKMAAFELNPMILGECQKMADEAFVVQQTRKTDRPTTPTSPMPELKIAK